ncbi:hypothetical protein PCL_10211 [Purpureocillium lilacinum]|uniref:Uncharacterized protein n=1 Tax=Purpureocillium lilacinum TaxID=33203 RepID=A0A2U3EFA7_PURLI|nr:hypothetical protein PCL_10211 [Purpureocillium lilacinum]
MDAMRHADPSGLRAKDDDQDGSETNSFALHPGARLSGSEWMEPCHAKNQADAVIRGRLLQALQKGGGDRRPIGRLWLAARPAGDRLQAPKMHDWTGSGPGRPRAKQTSERRGRPRNRALRVVYGRRSAGLLRIASAKYQDDAEDGTSPRDKAARRARDTRGSAVEKQQQWQQQWQRLHLRVL